jgi:SAM-dependent methyltransferase
MADIAYTFGYYVELNPHRSTLAFLDKFIKLPANATACELGFGQGLSTNIHAAASGTHWYGTDFNPSQAGFAKELAAISGAACDVFDQSFAEFCSRTDLPDFDYIGVHGIWSWISDENRAEIVDFVRRKLKVGGVLYISYNTLPGWSAFAPMRHLMAEHAEVIGAEGRGIVSRINDAIDFSEKLLATNPLYARANPQVAERIKSIKSQNRHYLAHEYFNRDWYPMHFSTMADWLEPAKLHYACSAHYLDHVNILNLTPEQQAFLAEIPDVMFRESVRDFMVNQQFRRDYWVKGARKLAAVEQMEQFRQQRFLLVTPRADVTLKASGALGEASMSAVVYDPILNVMADHKVRSVAQLEVDLGAQGINFAQLAQAIMILAGAGHLASVQEDAIQSKARKACDRLNEHLMMMSRSGNDVNYLASPATGGGIAVARFNQLFLLGMKKGHKTPIEMAKFTWGILKGQGQKILIEGKLLELEEENVAELQSQAEVFATKTLPILKALHIL